jgi:hypothetical protein
MKRNGMRTSILTLLLAFLSIITRTAEAGERNPFSRFSPKWDAPMFKKAKPSYDRDISKTDLELTHMVNLLRMDPVLFCHTVLLPRAVKTGKRRQAEAFLMRCRRAGRLDPLEITVYHRYTAKRLLDSLRRDGQDLCAGGGQPMDDSASARFAWRRTVSGKPLDILMELILDTHACSIAAAEAILARGMTVGILVRRDGDKGYETGLVVYAMTKTMAKNANRPSICDDITMEERRILEFTEDTTDAIMKAVRAEYPMPENIEARLVDYQTFRRIDDSLRKKNVSHVSDSHYYDHEMGDRDLKPLEDDPGSDKGFPGNPRSSSGYTSCNGHPEKSLYVYAINRNRSICHGIFEFEYHVVQVIASTFKYHPDSIGRIEAYKLDFTETDEYAESVEGDDAKTLAAALTSPFDSELQKVRAIHHWLDMKVEYDWDGLEDGTVSDEVDDVLKRKKAICKGYAETFKRLCELAGIRCRSVRGYVMGSSEVNHRWNTVNIDGKWYLVDVTLGSLFFLTPPDRFLRTHLPEDDSYTLLPDYVGRIKWSEAYEKREKENEESLKKLSPSKR